MTNKLGPGPAKDKYDCFRNDYVYMNTVDGPIIGNLKDITSMNYILSPFSDTKINDNGVLEYFLNDDEYYYEKNFVRGVKRTDKKSIENYIDAQNKSIAESKDKPGN